MGRKVIGVVLAGGAATRLPNKPLLPVRPEHGALAIDSSIALFDRTCIKDIRIVVPPSSPIPDILEPRFRYAVQQELTGVPHAVSIALDHVDDGAQVYVSCCDNIYSDTQIIDKFGQYLCVQDQLPMFKRLQLSGYDKATGYFSRPGTYVGPSIAGWFAAPGSVWREAAPGEDLVDFANRLAFDRYSVALNDWWDIGSVDLYTAYWRASR